MTDPSAYLHLRSDNEFPTVAMPSFRSIVCITTRYWVHQGDRSLTVRVFRSVHRSRRNDASAVSFVRRLLLFPYFRSSGDESSQASVNRLFCVYDFCGRSSFSSNEIPSIKKGNDAYLQSLPLRVSVL